MSDEVNSPIYYKGSKYEVIDIIEDYNLGFNLGNNIKYVLRAGHKDPSKTIVDLKKAMWYIQREISRLESLEEPEDKSVQLELPLHLPVE